MKKDKIESIIIDQRSVIATPKKKTIVNVFFNESDLADFIRNHQEYKIVSVFSHEGHITGIFTFYE